MDTIGAVLERAARTWPDAPALIDDASGRRWTFSQFAVACGGVGEHLRAQGLAPGARVAIIASASPEYLFADYGAMAAGFVRVPLDPALSEVELANQIRDADASVVLKNLSFPAVNIQFHGDSLASLNYTGGTSSAPKAVMHTHASLTAALANIAAARGTQPGEVMLNVRPLWPIAAIIVLAHLAAGGTVVLGGGFEPARFVEQLRRHRAASTSLVPTHLVRLLRSVPAAELASLNDLRAIDVGAAAIPPETFAEAIGALGPKIGVLYGLTEAPWSCYQPPSARAERMKSAGRPVAGCKLRIAEDTGEVLLSGSHLMQGYWKQPELTAQVLRDGWFHTGDQGVLDEEGVLSIRGRIKETIRSGGKSVQPEEVEETLLKIQGVKEACVVGLPDREWGEIVAAAVVASLTADQISEHCRAALSAHKRPKLIRVVDALPRSHYGKVQRAKVKALFGVRS